MNVASFRKASSFALSVAVALSVLPLPLFLAAAAAPVPQLTSQDMPWPQFGVTSGHSFTYNGTERGYNDVLLKWRLGSSPGGGSAVANFSADIALNNTTSKPDVLGVVVAQTGTIVIAAGNNGTPMWSYPVFGGVFATPVVSDFNLDGKPDVLIRDTNGLVQVFTPNITWDGSTYVFPFVNATERQAQERWNRTVSGSASTNNDLSTPIAANIVGNNVPEVLMPAGDTLFMLSGLDGAEMANKTVDGTIIGAPLVYQVASAWRVAVGSVNTTGVNTSLYTLTIFDASLNFLSARNFTQGYDPFLAKSLDLQLPSPAAGDLDGTGPHDDVALVTAYEDSRSHLRIFSNGSTTASTDVMLEGMTGASPAVTNLDQNGSDEVVALSYGPGRPSSTNSVTFVEVFNGNGTRRWNITIDEVPSFPREHVVAPPAIADLNGDGVLDIVVFLTDGWSEARSGTNGSRIFRHQQFDQAASTEFSAPAIADFDHDGFLDITAGGATVSYALAELHTDPADITFVPAVPQEFEDVTASATIHNTGNAGARNVTVDFMEGTQTLNSTEIPLILPSTTFQAQVVLNFSGGGARALTVRIDANNTVEEINETNNTATVVVNVTSNYGFHFESPLNRTAVQAGFSYAFITNVVGDGALDNTVNLSFSGLPSGWIASLNPAQVNLTGAGTPGDTNTSFFSVTTSGLSLPGEYDMNVSGVSVNSARNIANITFTVIIGGQYGVSMYPKNLEGNVTAGDLVPYTFSIINSGNSNDTIQFIAGTAPPGWSALSSRGNVTLGAGQTTTVILQVRAPANATSGENATITLTARSVGDPLKNDTVFALTFVVVPDLVVTDIRFVRECGGESTTGAPHLVVGDDSRISVTVANAVGNAAVTNVGVIVWVDGTPYTGAASVPANGNGVFNVTHKFTTAGLKIVTAEADPNNDISELSEANNALTEQTTVKDFTPIGNLFVEGWVLENATGVAFASVSVILPRTGLNVSATADSAGHYSTTLLAANYVDGDGLFVNATGGLDLGSVQGCAYSEDVTLTLNVNLSLPSPFDFLLVAVGPTSLQAFPGSSALYTIDIANRGSENNTIVLSTTGTWTARVMDANSTPTSVVSVGPRATLRIQVEVTPPGGLNPGDWSLTVLNATAAADGRTRLLSLNTSVGIVRQLQLAGPATISALSGTVVFLNVTVSNFGNVDETVTLAVADAQGSGAAVTFTPGAPTIPRAGSAVVAVRLSVPTSAPGGNFPLNFTATSDANVSVVGYQIVTLKTTVQRYDFSLTGATSVRIAPGTAKTTLLGIANLGTIPDTYDVSATAAPAGFTVRLLAGTTPALVFTAEPGTTTNVTIEITAPREVSLERFDITITVVSQGISNSSTGVPDRAFVLTALIGNIYDFRASGPTLSGPAIVDVDNHVLVTVENVGSRSFVGSLQVRLLVSGTVVSTQTLTSLGAGERTTLSFPWTPRVAGPVPITVDVNSQSGSDVYESSYSNNVGNATITVAPPTPSDIFSNPGTYLFIAIVLAILVVVAAQRGRRVDTEKQQDHEQAAEESEQRRKGGGPGGLGRL